MRQSQLSPAPLSLVLALAALLAAPAGHAAPPMKPDRSPPIFPFPMTVETLPNGLKVVMVPFDSPGLTAFYTLVRVGSRNEVEPGRTGFAHFFEHMMFRGTKTHPGDARDKLLSAAGVSSNAFTTDDFTAYYTFGPSAALPLIIELEADRFQNLDYSVEGFKTEALAVLGEYNKNFSNPVRRLDEVFSDTAYKTHTYKHTTMGFREDIEAMPDAFDYSRQFFERWYVPANTTLVFVGDFDKGETMRLVEKAYGGWNRELAEVPVPREPRQTAPKRVNVRWENPTSPLLLIGWHTPELTLTTRDAAIQNILAQYLFGPTSPLYIDLVLERQLALSLSPSYDDRRDPGIFGVFAMLKSDQGFKPVREAIAKSIDALRKGQVDAKRLATIKSAQKYGLLSALDNADAVAQILVMSMAQTGDPNTLDTIFRQMDAVKPADIVAFAKRHLVDTNQTLATLVGPGANPPADIPDYKPAARGAR